VNSIAANPTIARSASASPTTIRIDQEKLDRLMRVVGELLVARGAIPTLVEKLSAGEDRAVITRSLKEAGAGISHIAEELQASVMAIRMLPVKTVFQRFPRLVRDLARSLGKEIQLVVEGEAVELDKTIVDQIGDPLVHLVRNAVDHGLERPEERTARGKQPSGRLTLRASNDAGNVIIEVEDDGRGLDPEALKRKAVERGLVTREAALAMSPAEACRLAFLPGLSTAEKVTDVSGRGVGMDVVASNIRSLQGAVDIRSSPGAGTVISIKLPTSLIVSKGILLESGGQEYILPLSSIRDMVKVPAAEVHDYHGFSITQVRGEIYSVFSLAEMFGLPVRSAEEVPIAIIESGKVRYGLIADRFVSEVEVLVKPLAGGLEHSKEFHGAAIMGDGRVVLVLNPLECHRLDGVGAR
jgi:two-component system, chemotaxis family, sensor kinase CheA